jgi:S-adenosylmethionine hydrolase
MRRRLFVGIELCLGIALMLFLAAPATAQEKESKSSATKAKETRIDGSVHMIDTKTNTITVTLRGKTSQKEVVYNDKTQFTFRNKPSTFAEVKEGRRVIVLGTTNDKMQLVATRVDIRDTM